MVRGTLCVISVLLTLSAILAQPAPLESDALLQRRITVWLKMEPMRDALRQIGKQTGVTLRCIDAIAEEKVAIFVEDRPAHEILSQLAKVFRYEWRTHEDGGYMLYVPDETRLQEEKLENALREARRQALRDLVRTAREIRPMSRQQREHERSELRARYDSLSPSERTRLAVLRSMAPISIWRQNASGELEPAEEPYYADSYCVYHCLATLPDQAADALLKGALIGFSTKPPSGVFALPDDALLPNHMRDERTVQRNGDWYIQASPHNPEFSGVWLRVAPSLDAIEYLMVSVPKYESFGDEGSALRYLDTDEGAIRLLLEPYLRSTNELWAFWDNWATPLQKLQETLPERVPPRDDRPKPTLPNYRRGYHFTNSDLTLADGLELLAWATRRPLISDAFRAATFYYDSSAPREAIVELSNSLWMRADESGYLLARHKYYWSYRRHELPESWLRPLEQKYAQHEQLELDDYIALAGKLTDAQAEFLIQQRHWREFPLTRFEFEPLVGCLPALRFLASLNAAQRQQIASGQWLPRRRLSSIQQRRFQEAIGERFPPPPQLFREPFPENIAQPDNTRNLVDTMWNYIDQDDEAHESLQSPENLPQEPAVRLQRERLATTLFILAHDGHIRTTFNSAMNAPSHYQYLRSQLEENPGSRLMAARLRQYLIEFVDEQGERHRYELVLSRYEPYELPSPKPEEKKE
ncbi:MAG: hypothetical protein NZM28_03570 [Fimbriimonadales bacterium]|nr:hypothetical protein [Fimbriimonadales bacterium]